MKHFLTALLLLSLLFQAGCARSTPDGTSGPQAESPQLAYEATFDDGAFSPIDPGAVCYDLLEIRLCVLDEEAAKALFFPEDPILEENSREDNGRRGYNVICPGMGIWTSPRRRKRRQLSAPPWGR